jgi:hypothetical protein
LIFILLLNFFIWLSNILSLSMPQEIYARNVTTEQMIPSRN